MMVSFGENRLAVTDPAIQKQIVELVVFQNPVLSAPVQTKRKVLTGSKMNKAWSEKDKELLLEFIVEGRSIPEIAMILGRTKNAIRVQRSKLNSGK